METLGDLGRLGRLLDQAVDLADRCGESLLAAQIAQAVHQLDLRIASERPAPMRESGALGRRDGHAAG